MERSRYIKTAITLFIVGLIALGCAPTVEPNPTRAATVVKTPRPTVPRLPTFTPIPHGGPVFPEPVYARKGQIVVLAGQTGYYLSFGQSKPKYNETFYECFEQITNEKGVIAFDAWVINSFKDIQKYQIAPCQ